MALICFITDAVLSSSFWNQHQLIHQMPDGHSQKTSQTHKLSQSATSVTIMARLSVALLLLGLGIAFVHGDGHGGGRASGGGTLHRARRGAQSGAPIWSAELKLKHDYVVWTCREQCKNNFVRECKEQCGCYGECQRLCDKAKADVYHHRCDRRCKYQYPDEKRCTEGDDTQVNDGRDSNYKKVAIDVCRDHCKNDFLESMCACNGQCKNLCQEGVDEDNKERNNPYHHACHVACQWRIGLGLREKCIELGTNLNTVQISNAFQNS